MKTPVVRLVSAPLRPHVLGREKAGPWGKDAKFEVADGEFSVILTAGGRAKDDAIATLSFAAKYDDVDVYFQGRLTGRAGHLEAEAMQGQVKVLDAESLLAQDAQATEEDIASVPYPKYPLVILDLTGAPISSVSSDRVLRLVRQARSKGSAVIVFTVDPALALAADSVHRLTDEGIQRIAL